MQFLQRSARIAGNSKVMHAKIYQFIYYRVTVTTRLTFDHIRPKDFIEPHQSSKVCTGHRFVAVVLKQIPEQQLPILYIYARADNKLVNNILTTKYRAYRRHSVLSMISSQSKGSLVRQKTYSGSSIQPSVVYVLLTPRR